MKKQRVRAIGWLAKPISRVWWHMWDSTSSQRACYKRTTSLCPLCPVFLLSPLKSAFFKIFPLLLKKYSTRAQFPFSGILTREKGPLKFKNRSLNGGILGTSERRTEGLLDQSNSPEIIHQKTSCFTHSEFDLLDEEDQIQGGKRNRWTYRESGRRKKKLKILSDPIHPLATKNLSKECQLLNLIPTLEGY